MRMLDLAKIPLPTIMPNATSPVNSVLAGVGVGESSEGSYNNLVGNLRVFYVIHLSVSTGVQNTVRSL